MAEQIQTFVCISDTFVKGKPFNKEQTIILDLNQPDALEMHGLLLGNDRIRLATDAEIEKANRPAAIISGGTVDDDSGDDGKRRKK